MLTACGVDAKILTIYGAGRTLLSKGFIEPARRHAAHLLDEIRRSDPNGILPVVGLEPSEIYTLRDEFLDLLPDRHEEIEALAARAWLIDEFLVRPAERTQKLRVANILRSKINAEKPKILLHGHCYQKAQPPRADGYPVGVNASAELLRAVGYDLEVIQSGCCGMAGAFGYETEHYDVSMKVGELVLFPAIRAAASATGAPSIAAAGTSCRAQISDGVGLQADHSVVLVAQMLNAARSSDRMNRE